MEQHGRNLAVAHRLAPGRAPDRLLSRLAENERILIDVCDLLTAAVTANRRITPAAEWLLDNFYLIEEQIRTAKRHLPRGYSRELPRLAQGASAKLPRVYDLAFEAISHGDGRVDADTLSRFVAAYQTVAPLTVGELWAIPIMLRLGMIENLRRVGAGIATGTLERNRAAGWADQMMDVALHDPKGLILVIADMARSGPSMAGPFVAELARRLQGQSAALALPLTWIEQCLSEAGLSIEQSVQAETQEQASVQVSISNTIGSLRFLGSMDWREFVESMSVVEAKLREDPGGFYTQDGLRDPRPLPARRGGDREDQRLVRRRGGAQGDPARPRGRIRLGRGERRRCPHGARRFLSHRPGARASRAGGGQRPVDGRSAPQDRTAQPAPLLPGRDRGDHGRAHRNTAREGAWRRRRRSRARRARNTPAARHESARRRPGELGVDIARDPAPVAADGLRQRPSRAGANPGGGPDAPHQRRRHRGPGRGAGGPVPRQSRRPPALQPADRFCGRSHGNASRRRNAAGARAEGHRGTEREVRKHGPDCGRHYGLHRHVLSLPPSTPLESARKGMDGPRAQAREACRPQRFPARRRERFLLARRRTDRGADGREVRDHARHGHAVAARLGAPVRRSDGAPAQPPALRGRRQGRGRRTRDRRVRNPAAARRHQPAGREPFVVRASARRRPGHRPLHARRLGRLPGRVRARAPSSARGSTTSTRSKPPSGAAFQRTGS